ncbi:glycosyltransferase family 2 protein [Sphingomonas aracearum]|uniref:glycosyltransferase family 2 protein n=1 Tax=Sphingomonas aracearum TaxID=2283317 RepID=UPI001EEFDBF1|nr:glycosyltransferase family 2 protein [Sphingomonas aracearum]
MTYTNAQFGESHQKSLIARQALGASLPLAGVGCGIGRDWLERIAVQRGGLPFDPASLTEDYELGLAVATLGGSGVLAWVGETRGGRPVAVREYFPSSLNAAIRQKARWMTGIALAGWDRVGWGRLADWREHWMRARDRRAPLAVLVLAAAYLALMALAAAWLLHRLSGTTTPPVDAAMQAVLTINAALLCWRLAMRALFTGRAYGWRQAALSLPRAFVANYISLMAARLAVSRYIALLRGGALRWDKTRHAFPDDVEEAA